MRYSRLTQFNPENVSRLTIAWVFRTGDVSDGKHGKQRSGFKTTPILVDGLPIFAAGFKVIAVNPEAGKLQKAYDPKIDPTWDDGDAQVNRGLATWLAASRGAQTRGPCRRRIARHSSVLSCAPIHRLQGGISANQLPNHRPAADQRSSLWPA
jgi:quinoprotein glucose dehydrogenase